jgi:hypothetical protein
LVAACTTSHCQRPCSAFEPARRRSSRALPRPPPRLPPSRSPGSRASPRSPPSRLWRLRLRRRRRGRGRGRGLRRRPPSPPGGACPCVPGGTEEAAPGRPRGVSDARFCDREWVVEGLLCLLSAVAYTAISAAVLFIHHLDSVVCSRVPSEWTSGACSGQIFLQLVLRIPRSEHIKFCSVLVQRIYRQIVTRFQANWVLLAFCSFVQYMLMTHAQG